ncbi:hypothetical protein SNEBB_007174 [Seison nebaliae]|nr:hypothetical protein SNEBB_007174 [Seison nebaliae]
MPWKNGKIAFHISKSFEKTKYLKEIYNGIDVWQKKSCLDFVQISNRSMLPEAHLIIEKSRNPKRCYTEIRTSTSPSANLYLGMICIRKFNTIIHELGHVVGLAHEHQRMDRHHYIKYDISALRRLPLSSRLNIVNDMIIRMPQYEIFPYDPFSIMHYSSKFIKLKKIPNLMKTENLTISDIEKKMGMSKQPSKTDRQALNKLYTCENNPRNFTEKSTNKFYLNYCDNCNWRIRRQLGERIEFQFLSEDVHLIPVMNSYSRLFRQYYRTDCSGILTVNEPFPNIMDEIFEIFNEKKFRKLINSINQKKELQYFSFTYCVVNKTEGNGNEKMDKNEILASLIKNEIYLTDKEKISIISYYIHLNRISSYHTLLTFKNDISLNYRRKKDFVNFIVKYKTVNNEWLLIKFSETILHLKRLRISNDIKSIIYNISKTNQLNFPVAKEYISKMNNDFNLYESNFIFLLNDHQTGTINISSVISDNFYRPIYHRKNEYEIGLFQFSSYDQLDDDVYQLFDAKLISNISSKNYVRSQILLRLSERFHSGLLINIKKIVNSQSIQNRNVDVIDAPLFLCKLEVEESEQSIKIPARTSIIDNFHNGRGRIERNSEPVNYILNEKEIIYNKIFHLTSSNLYRNNSWLIIPNGYRLPYLYELVLNFNFTSIENSKNYLNVTHLYWNGEMDKKEIVILPNSTQIFNGNISEIVSSRPKSIGFLFQYNFIDHLPNHYHNIDSLNFTIHLIRNDCLRKYHRCKSSQRCIFNYKKLKVICIEKRFNEISDELLLNCEIHKKYTNLKSYVISSYNKRRILRLGNQFENKTETNIIERSLNESTTFSFIRHRKRGPIINHIHSYNGFVGQLLIHGKCYHVPCGNRFYVKCRQRTYSDGNLQLFTNISSTIVVDIEGQNHFVEIYVIYQPNKIKLFNLKHHQINSQTINKYPNSYNVQWNVTSDKYCTYFIFDGFETEKSDSKWHSCRRFDYLQIDFFNPTMNETKHFIDLCGNELDAGKELMKVRRNLQIENHSNSTIEQQPVKFEFIPKNIADNDTNKKYLIRNWEKWQDVEDYHWRRIWNNEIYLDKMKLKRIGRSRRKSSYVLSFRVKWNNFILTFLSDRSGKFPGFTLTLFSDHCW